MNFFEMIEKRQTQEPVKQDNSLTLDMVRRDWYRQGIDPDLATKAWEWATDSDKDGALADFFVRYFDKETGGLIAPPTINADSSPEVVLQAFETTQTKRKPGRPKKVKA
jgi:hypothetical protein